MHRIESNILHHAKKSRRQREREIERQKRLTRLIIEYESLICNVCNNNGYIKTFCTKYNKDTVQRCDTCKMYNEDKEAIRNYNLDNINQF